MTTGMLNAPQEGVPGEGLSRILSGSQNEFIGLGKNVKELTAI